MKVYAAMYKQWIEDFYEEDTFLYDNLFSTYDKALDYIKNYTKLEKDGVVVETIYNGENYFVIYDKWIQGDVDIFGIETLWQSERASWCYIKEMEVE